MCLYNFPFIWRNKYASWKISNVKEIGSTIHIMHYIKHTMHQALHKTHHAPGTTQNTPCFRHYVNKTCISHCIKYTILYSAVGSHFHDSPLYYLVGWWRCNPNSKMITSERYILTSQGSLHCNALQYPWLIVSANHGSEWRGTIKL